MQEPVFTHDVFLSHSAKDKAVVRPLAERLWADGPRRKAEFRRQKAEILHSSFFLHPFPRDWAHLTCPAIASERRRKVGTCGRRNLRFRDPLNRERRFIPLRLDDAPIKGSLAQFPYINWQPADRGQEGLKARKKLVQRRRNAMNAALGEPRTT